MLLYSHLSRPLSRRPGPQRTINSSQPLGLIAPLTQLLLRARCLREAEVGILLCIISYYIHVLPIIGALHVMNRLVGEIASHQPPLLLPGEDAPPLLHLLKCHMNILGNLFVQCVIAISISGEVLRSADSVLLIRDVIQQR